MLTSRFLFSFTLCLLFFFGGIFLRCSFQRSFVYDVRNEQRGGRSRGAQNFGQFCQWLCIVFVEGVFLCVKCRDFLHLCRCLVLHCFLETSSIYSSFIEKKEVRRLIKVGSINVRLLSCQVYYTYETCKHCALQQRKWLCISVLISLLKLIRNISKYHFSSEGVLLNSIMDIN